MMTNDAPVLSAGEIIKATEGTLLCGAADWSCRGLSTDTRTLREGNLFIALAGERFDGHDYLAAAAGRGASGLLIRRDAAERLSTLAQKPPVIGVLDTLRALGDIAHDWRRRFPVQVAAVTGSSGKTTTKEMLASIASRSLNVLATEGNFNNLIGLPLTLLRMRPEHQLAVVEMGTNSPGEIARLAVIAAPDVGLITNIGPAHLEGLGSLEAIREEKGELFQIMAGRGTAIINHDDPAIGVLAKRWQGSRIIFGFKPGADVTARNIETAGPAAVRFQLVIAASEYPVQLSTPGGHNVVNALAAAAAALALGFDGGEIAAGLAAFCPIPGRMEVRQLSNGAFLIVDSYNANPASVREALKTLRGLRGAGRSFAVLGDMLELGERAEYWHEEIGAFLAETGTEAAFLKGALIRATAAAAVKGGLPAERIVLFEKPEEIVRLLGTQLRKGDWILVKGSRKMKMELIAAEIIKAFDREAETV